MTDYEHRLARDSAWAVREGGSHFSRGSAVHKTLERIVRQLQQMRIPYAIGGGMALFFHGYRRFTEDVDILVTADGLERIHRELEGAGYRPPFPGSRGLRDAESGVRIEFLVSGEYPGDGKPKPVCFPEPDRASAEIDGIRFLSLEKLVELKLASGVTPGRRKDLGDVQELIRTLALPLDFAQRLDPSVRATYHELWAELEQLPPVP